MRVIVRHNGEDLVFNSDEQPITLVLDATDKTLIGSMRPHDTKYTSFPAGSDHNDIRAWLAKPRRGLP